VQGDGCVEARLPLWPLKVYLRAVILGDGLRQW